MKNLMKVIIKTVVAAVLTIVLILLFAGNLGFNRLTLGLFSVFALLIWGIDACIKIEYEDFSACLVNLVAIGLYIVFWIGTFFASSSMTKAKIVAETGRPQQVAVEESNLPESLDSLCLMDSETALTLARRKAGEKAEIVSQYDIDKCYTQIFQGEIVKIVTLKYAGMPQTFKNDSIPYYILVRPSKNTAELIAVEGGIKFAPCDYMSQDLVRQLRKKGYRKDLLGDVSFVIDEEGNPFWSVVVEKYATFMGARTPKSAVLVNAVTGEIQEYALNALPTWVDGAISGNTAANLYNRYGKLNNGFWNLSKANVTVTTQDFGYLSINGEMWYYTGITSVTEDESNIGFLLVNSRTAESQYYLLGGAEEYSAMAAAEGAIQNFGYKASFPSLVMVGGEPTYVMVLKDANGLVKDYAMVNYKNYTIVNVAETMEKTEAGYLQQLGGRTADTIISETITIAKITFIAIDGNTVVYITATNGDVYKTTFSEEYILLEEGDTLEVNYITKGSVTSILN